MAWYCGDMTFYQWGVDDDSTIQPSKNDQKNKKENKKMKKIAEFLNKTKELLNGEEFEDLGKNQKQVIFDTFLETGIPYELEGDSDGCYLRAEQDELAITFFSRSDYTDEKKIRDRLSTLGIWIDGEDVSIDEAIDYANLHISKMPLALLNTSILTAEGTYTLRDITLEEAKALVASSELDSAIGHVATALVMEQLLGIEIPVRRQVFTQQPGQQALVFKLNGRPAEGRILSVPEIEEIGYKFQLLTRIE